MIRAEHLQIGCWVKYTNPPYIQVASITKKKIGYHIKPNEPRMHYVRLCEVEPIPLTAEILEKNGFESESNIFGARTYSLNKEYVIEDRCSSMCLCRIKNSAGSLLWVCDINSVHQLQNVLRLCEIAKEIEL